MLSKVLISCALFVAVQAYAPSGYGGRSSNAGYAAQREPVATVYVLPSYGNSYGAAPAYSAAPAYGAYASSYGAAGGVDAEVLRLAKLALSLPSAGGPNAVVNNVPQHYSTSYTAPASYVESAGSGYGAVQAAPGYGAPSHSAY